MTPPDRPPAYTATPPPPPLIERIRHTQTTRITSLLTTHIDPFLTHLAETGHPRAILVMVPRDATDLCRALPRESPILEKQPFVSVPHDEDEDEDDDEIAILGFPTDAHVRFVRLDGEDVAFWSEKSVVAQVQKGVEERVGGPSSSPLVATPSSLGSVGGTRRFWQRRGWKPARRASTPTPERETWTRTRMHVRVSNEEVSLRVRGPMELWAVRSGFAVVLRVSLWDDR